MTKQKTTLHKLNIEVSGKPIAKSKLNQIVSEEDRLPETSENNWIVFSFSCHAYPCVIGDKVIEFPSAGLILRGKNATEIKVSREAAIDLLSYKTNYIMLVSKATKKALDKESSLSGYKNRIFCYEGQKKKTITNYCNNRKKKSKYVNKTKSSI